MKLIRSEEIQGKLLTLINTSEEFVLLISPNVNITKWYALVKGLRNAENRDLPVKFFIRDHEKNTSSETCLDDLGFQYEKFEDLHFKIYLNEDKAIITSLNLLINSMINSLEIGYETTTKEEYEEVIGFIESTLRTSVKTVVKPEEFSIKERWLDLKEALEKEYILCDPNDDKFTCRIKRAGNNFFIKITEQGNFSIDGVIYKKQLSAAEKWAERIGENLKLKSSAEEKGHGAYATVRVSGSMYQNGYENIVKCVADFAEELNECRSKSKNLSILKL